MKLLKTKFVMIFFGIASIIFSNQCVADEKSGYTAFQKQDYKTALKEFTLLANSGSDVYMNMVGMMHQNGMGTPIDYELAMIWYKKAVNLSNLDALNNLGIMYRDGLGVRKSTTEAMKYFLLAAERNYGKSMMNLALMNLRGFSEENQLLNFNDAREWANRAIKQNFEPAKNLLEVIDLMEEEYRSRKIKDVKQDGAENEPVSKFRLVCKVTSVRDKIYPDFNFSIDVDHQLVDGRASIISKDWIRFNWDGNEDRIVTINRATGQLTSGPRADPTLVSGTCTKKNNNQF